MTQEKFRQRTEAAIERIKSAPIDAELQDSLVELVEDARIATNGLSQDEKIQVMSENQFTMAILLVQTCIASLSDRCSDDEKKNDWKSILVRCKKEIMWGFLGLIALIAFRPSIAETVSAIIGGIAK